MDLLASYDDDGEKSQSSSTNKQDQIDVSSSLQAEWESFEKMIAGESEEKPSSVQEFLQSGIVAYPGLFENNEDSEEISEDKPASVEEADAPKKSRSFADDVMKLFRSEFVEKELDMPPRARSSSSHSSGSSRSTHSSRSGSASPSPDRGGDKEEDKEEEEEELEKETREGERKDRKASTESSSKKHRSRSRSRHKRRSHSRRKSRSSRSRSRRRSRDRKESSSHKRRRRSRSRDRKRRRHSSRDRHRHKKERRRSRSRDRHRKRSHRSRSRHRSRSPHKHRSAKSRSRSRDRSHHPAPSSSKPEGEKHLTFKEKMRQQLLKASKYLQAGEGLEIDGTPKEKPSTLPLSDGHKKFFEALASSTQSSVTPQMALLHTMAAMHQKAQEMTGVAVPKYYNPAAVNPLKYAEQVQKRKLLWSKAKEHKEDKEKEWQQTAFNQDENGKMASKFKKLMGIKHEGAEGDPSMSETTEEQKKKRDEFFSRLDKDYEFARMTTHTQRGVGLGFSSQGIQPP